jgi:hypothetical protein
VTEASLVQIVQAAGVELEREMKRRRPEDLALAAMKAACRQKDMAELRRLRPLYPRQYEQVMGSCEIRGLTALRPTTRIGSDHD